MLEDVRQQTQPSRKDFRKDFSRKLVRPQGKHTSHGKISISIESHGVADYATRQRPRHHQLSSFGAGIEAAFPDFLICRKQSHLRCTVLRDCCANLAAQIKFLG